MTQANYLLSSPLVSPRLHVNYPRSYAGIRAGSSAIGVPPIGSILKEATTMALRHAANGYFTGLNHPLRMDFRTDGPILNRFCLRVPCLRPLIESTLLPEPP